MAKSNASQPAKLLLEAAQVLTDELRKIEYSQVCYQVYEPLDYAWELYKQYVTKYVHGNVTAVFVGMNPGPWGMTQSGVPFGEIAVVREWLCLSGTVKQPSAIHPKRPIEGLDCKRSEVSGRRLWGLFRERFSQPETFFQEHFVANYCPLTFMNESGGNLTPDKFPASVRTPMEKACDAHLATTIQILKPRFLIGVGGFAEKCCLRSLEGVELNDPPMSFEFFTQAQHLRRPIAGGRES